jgi:hypothetical protein
MYELPNIPVFETEAELQAALGNRGKGKDGSSPEETGEIREQVQQNVVKEIADAVSEREETP